MCLTSKCWPQVLSCITFGAPAVTGKAHATRHSEQLLHFVHGMDLVPRILLLKKTLYDIIVKIVHEYGKGVLDKVVGAATFLGYSAAPRHAQAVCVSCN